MPTGQPLGPPAEAPLRLQTLGTAALTLRAGPGAGPEPILGPGKPFALITYLALSPGRLATREHLTDLLWADLEPERARHSLRQTIWQLRQALGEEALTSPGSEIHLEAPVSTDRDEFLDAIERQDFAAAVELYGGPFLPSFAIPGGLEFEQWAGVERTRLRNTFLRVAEAQTRRLIAAHRYREAQQLARRTRDTDPLDERGWRLLIEARYAGGDALGAELECDGLLRMLKEEGRDPEPASTSLIGRIRQPGALTRSQDESRALLADLIGREREFSTILEAWEQARSGRPAQCCVTAPAGMGKTRLLQDLRARLVLAGASVVYVRANPGDRHVSYAYACDMAAALAAQPGATGVPPEVAGSLLALNPTLSNIFSANADHAVGQEAFRRRTVALVELLAAVAEQRPVALLLDDMHWADPVSVKLLEGVRTRLQGQHVLLVTGRAPGLAVVLPPIRSPHIPESPDHAAGARARVQPWRAAA